jgi:transglutaminase-like putative cysteine protease
MRRAPRASLVALLCALAIPALAQPVLHEYVPNLAAGEGSSLVSSHDDVSPSAILHDGELLTAPPLDERAPDEAPLRATPGDGGLREEAGRRSPSFRPDRITALETGVDYFEVFSPALRPYKRMSALDRIELAPDRTPVLLARDRPRTHEPVELPGAIPPDARPRDRFWGSVVIDFATGREVPFPTVSPESRLLGVETAPEVPIHFERDASDNLYAVLDAPAGSDVGEVRVVFLTDAPRTYFGVEAGASLPHARADALAAEVPPLPEAVQAEAVRVLAELGVRRDQPFDVVLERLVEHFRSFEESSEPPPDTGHIYLDLVRGRRGVCRHRAYAFVITAQQLGIPARFVQNEAHAWVEVHLPENRGWLRVDLGGSAQGVRTHGPGEDAPPYRPNVSDPLPQPPAYRAALEAAARASLLGSGRAGTSEGTGEASGEGWTEVGELGAGETGADVPAPAGPTPAGRAALALSADQDLFEVRRGLTIEVSGLATSLGAPVPGLRVEIALFDPERARERLLGVAVTDEAGVYRATVGIPPDTPTGHYHLDIRSPGDDHVGPASVR